MNQSEFACFHNVSRKTVTTWKNKGLIVLNADGTIDVDKSNEYLKQNRSGKYQVDLPDGNKVSTENVVAFDEVVTNFHFQGNNFGGNNQGNTSGEYVHVDRVESDTELEMLSRGEIDKLLQIEKLKVETQKARAAQFETDIREGRLLLAEDVGRHDAEVGSRLQKKLLALPTELAVRIAAISSPAEVEGLLRAEITEALNEFLDAYGVHYS